MHLLTILEMHNCQSLKLNLTFWNWSKLIRFILIQEYARNIKKEDCFSYGQFFIGTTIITKPLDAGKELDEKMKVYDGGRIF